MRVLHEMTAAGWSNGEIAVAVRRVMQGWAVLLTDVMTEAQARDLPLGPFTPQELATLLGLMFVGGESLLLVGMESEQYPIRAALRRVGDLIRQAEEGGLKR